MVTGTWDDVRDHLAQRLLPVVIVVGGARVARRIDPNYSPEAYEGIELTARPGGVTEAISVRRSPAAIFVLEKDRTSALARKARCDRDGIMAKIVTWEDVLEPEKARLDLIMWLRYGRPETPEEDGGG